MAKERLIDLDQLRRTSVFTRPYSYIPAKLSESSRNTNIVYNKRISNSGMLPNTTWKQPTNYRYERKVLTDLANGTEPVVDGFPFETYRLDRNSSEPFKTRWGIWGEIPSDIPLLADKYRLKESYWTGSDAIRKAYNRSNDSDLHLGMFFAGMPQTFTFVAEQALSLRKGLRLLKRGRLREAAIALGKKPKSVRDFKNAAKASTEELSNRWLELQFAWGPLLADIHAIMNYQPVPQSQGDMPTIHSRGIGKLHYEETKVTDDGDHFYGPLLRHTSKVKSETFSLCRMDFRVGDYKLYQQSLLGLINPLEIAWDLLPYSFVVDWFMPVGSTIQAMTADAGLDYIGGSLTNSSKTSIVTTTRGRTEDFGSYLTSTNGEADFLLESHIVNREALTDRPNLRFPSVKYPSSMWHAMTSLSLLSQQLR